MHKKEEVYSFLKKNNFIPSKKMGQNFLCDLNLQKKIIQICNLTKKNDVIEIGPGLGALTKNMINDVNHLLAIELDKRLYAYLKQHMDYKNFILINDDILKINLEDLIEQYQLKNIKVVANLPYSISSQIILKLIKMGNINDIYIMVQKEMAQRICAQTNTKHYNAFSALLAAYCHTKVLFEINNENFIPKPQIDSVFLHLKYFNKYNLEFNSINSFLKLCFGAKRKTLVNNLTSKYNKNRVIKILNNLSLDEKIRAEEIEIEVLVKIYEQLSH